MRRGRRNGARLEQDLFRSRLDQIIDLNYGLVKLAKAMDWRFLDEQCGAAYSDRPGQPPLPTRLMAVIGHLKEEHRMGRNHLAHTSGDAINVVLAAAGYNFRRLIRWLSSLLLRILIARAAATRLKSA